MLQARTGTRRASQLEHAIAYKPLCKVKRQRTIRATKIAPRALHFSSVGKKTEGKVRATGNKPS